jgi:hypothetical protein
LIRFSIASRDVFSRFSAAFPPELRELVALRRDDAARPLALGLRAVDLRAVDLRAVDLRAVVLRAVVLRAVVLRAPAALPAVLRLAVLRAAGDISLLR